MKNLLVGFIKMIAPWLFKGYIVWSICADVALLAGILWLLFK